MNKSTGRVIERNLGPKPKPGAFPTPRESIDWNKSSVVTIPVSDTDFVIPEDVLPILKQG